jgi:hypothetical protein
MSADAMIRQQQFVTVQLLVQCPLPPNLNYGQCVWAICGFLPSELIH